MYGHALPSRVRIAAILVILGGCELAFPLRDRPADRVCEPGPFPSGVPVRLDTSESVEAARFVPDRSTIYLSLCSGTDIDLCDLYQGTYNEELDEYGVFARLEVSDDTHYDSYPTITPDTDFILFGSNRAGSFQVFVAGSVDGRFQNASPLPIKNVTNSNEPYLLADGRTLYLSGDAGDLFRSSGTPPMFGTFDPVGEINTADVEAAPVASDDELEIYFASNRQQPAEQFGLDIYTAVRATTESPFETPTRIAAISQSTTVDWPLWISPDRCDLYYINKDGDQATLFVSTR